MDKQAPNLEEAIDIERLIDEAVQQPTPPPAPLRNEQTEAGGAYSLLETSPEIELNRQWDDILARTRRPALLSEALQSSNLSGVYSRYLQGLAAADATLSGFVSVANSPEVLSAISQQTPAIIAGLYGSADHAPGAAVSSGEDQVGLRSEASIAERFVEHAEDPEANPLPSAIRLAMEAAVPALIAAAATRFQAMPRFEKKVGTDQQNAVRRLTELNSVGDAFADRLYRDLPIVRALATEFAHRLVARGKRVNLQQSLKEGRLNEFRRVAGPAKVANEYVLRHVARTLAQAPGVDHSYEAYLAEHTLGAPRELNRTEHIWLGDGYSAFPALKSVSDMDQGLTIPHRVELKEADRLFHPYLLFHRGYTLPLPAESSLDGSKKRQRKATLLEAVYGLAPDTMQALQQIALGEAAVVNLDEKAITQAQKAIREAMRAGEPLDGGRTTIVQSFINEFVDRPKRGEGAGAQSLAKAMAERSEKEPSLKWSTGPRGLTLLLRAMGADDPRLADALLVHCKQVRERLSAGGIRPRSFGAGPSLAASPARAEIIRGTLLGNTLLNAIRMKNVPVMRTNGLAPGETLEKDADASYRMQRMVADHALRLQSEHGDKPAPDATVAELQTAFGYLVLGADAYARAQLPMTRSVTPPERLGPGVVESLQGKTGLVRSAFFGTRFDNSTRLKVLADTKQSIDQAVFPPYSVAVIRGDYLRTILLAPAELTGSSGLSQEATFDRVFLGKLAGVFSRQTKSSDFAQDLSSWASGFVAEVERRAGAEAAAQAKAGIRRFCDSIPEPHKAEAIRLMLGTVEAPGALQARRVSQYVAAALLAHPMVKPVIAEVNEYYPVMLSRYPVIHHHSYVALKPTIGDPENNAVYIHPEVAGGLNADFDGDAVDVWGPLPFSTSPEQAKIWRVMLETHSPNRALLNSGSGTQLIYRFVLNASEGLVKANLCSIPAGGVSANRVIIDAGTAERLLREVLPDRDTLLSSLRRDPVFLVKLQGQWLERVRAETGREAIPLAGYVLTPDGKATTLSRLFFHTLLETISRGNEKIVVSALGPKYLGRGETATTSGKAVDHLLVTHAIPDSAELRSKEPGDHLGALHGSFYTYFAAEATAATQSVVDGGVNTPEMFAEIARDRLVTDLKELFVERLAAVEQAQSAGVISDDQAKTLLMRLEGGTGPVEEKDFGGRPGFASLLAAYRAAGPEQVTDAEKAIETFLRDRVSNPQYGLKPLAKAAIRFACERFARNHGHPHLLVEQLLTDKVKANEEVLYRFFMGTANLIDGAAVPTSFGGLVDAPTTERLLKSGAPALDKAIRSKTEVPATGTAFKELELVMAGVTVTRKSGDMADSWRAALSYRVADFVESEAALNYLAHNLTLRVLRIEPSSALPSAQREALEQLFRDAIEVVPFERKNLIEAIRQLYKADATAVVQVRSVLMDQAVGNGVSAEGIGYITTAGPGGLKIDEQGRIRRIALSEAGGYIGYPVGGILAGASSQVSTQNALRTRHITGSGIEEYKHIGDWHKVVHGPFPQRSPFFRQGGDRIKSAVPLAHPGFETYSTAFTAPTKDADRAFSMARARMAIAGVEILPGEGYAIRSGLLIVGTDRPKVWTTPVAPEHKLIAENGVALRQQELSETLRTRLEPVAPAAIRLQMSEEDAKAIGARLNDPVVGYQLLPRIGPGVALLRTGSTLLLHVPIRSVRTATKFIADALQVSPDSIKPRVVIAPGAEMVPIGPETQAGAEWALLSQIGAVRYRVNGQDPLGIGSGTPLAPGSVIDPSTNLAHRSLDREVTKGLSGFDAFLGFISGKTLAARSPLSEHTGVVSSVEFLARRGEACDFEATIKTTAGDRRQVFRLPDGDLPCIMPGQSLERGRPLGFGAVDLAERSALRSDVAQRELSQYLMAYSYSEDGTAPAPVVTEMQARCLFVDGKFTFIKDLAVNEDLVMATSPWQLAGRSGKTETLLNAAHSPLLTPGFGRSFGILDAAVDVTKEAHPVHLFPTRHPDEMTHASTVAEKLAAMGLVSPMLHPLEKAAVKAAEREAKAVEPTKVTGYGKAPVLQAGSGGDPILGLN